MLDFDEENVRCFQKGDALIWIEGDHAELSRQVECMPQQGGGERHKAAIEGWFELKK